MTALPARAGQTDEQIREHYEIEKSLAAKLLEANKTERSALYSSLYEELYRLVPHHPQLTRKISPEQRQQDIQHDLGLLKKFLNKDVSYLEVGPGDCAFSFAVADFVKKVFAVDVSKTITDTAVVPGNFNLILSDGCSIPVPKGSIDIAFSNQLMEHLHPDDAYEQLSNIFDALAPDGVYVCITPNRLNGPHDISLHFDTVATGFHLKEYTVHELSKLFKQVGFSKTLISISLKGRNFTVPVLPVVVCERMLELLPPGPRRKIASATPFRQLINIRLIGTK
ncbi:MAG: class I SAM-dependent methyltransferase [Gammaproteobacteria bacterium]|nr:class I SAM-dependent methyltransferase [Gammaproteobacteria bacterium]